MSKELGRNQVKALAALLEHSTIGDAAAACGLSHKTLTRYMQDPAFMAELRRVEGAAIDQATRRLLSLVDPAVDAIRDVLQDDQASHYERMRAGELVFGRLVALRELRDVEERLSELEAAVYGNENDS